MIYKNIIPIPHWMCGALVRNGKSFKDVLHYSKIRELFSAEELAGIIALRNLLRETAVFKDTFRSDQSYISIEGVWFPDLYPQPGEDKNYKEYSNVVWPLSQSVTVIEDVKARLSTINRTESEKLYQIYDCERDSALFVVYPGFFEALGRPKFQYGIYKRLLELFYVYFGLTKSCEQPLFGGYLKLLNSLSKT